LNWTLEVIVVPVSNIDRAKDFYGNQLGFIVDHDTRVNETVRVVQLTPPGSGCSIVIGTGIASMSPGSLKGLQLVVKDIEAARDQLVQNRVQVSEITLMGGQPENFAGEALDNIGFIFFDDPDGNSWAVQQISTRG
jgi:catechol 2,3-dioxygenase-like lactoylglutathione lyase family enzyme